MILPLWYWILCGVSCVGLIVLDLIDEYCLRYDVYIDDKFIKGCRMKLHPFRHEIEVMNPKTREVVVIVYKMYSIDREYYVWRKGK